MTSSSEVMCRKKVNTPWSIYRDFTVSKSLRIYLNMCLRKRTIFNKEKGKSFVNKSPKTVRTKRRAEKIGIRVFIPQLI